MDGAAPFTHLGRYRVLRELGRGAMGIVYLAGDEALQRQVAIKTLQLPEEGFERRNLEARFLQEAKAAGGLNHPNIITIHDVGRERDWLYIAMELLQGVELRERMERELLPLPEVLEIAGQVASALAAAHARGVVHRDVKPGNIMLLPGGQAKIMDFGIARMKSSDLRTQSGTMMGSPKYMSPEQVGGHPVDHRSDIFSMGSMLYEMVAGVPAFAGDNLGQLLNAILHGAPPPARQFRAGVPPALDLVIARAMQKNPEARYQEAGEMAREMAQCLGSITRPRGALPTPEPAVDPYATTAVTPVVAPETEAGPPEPEAEPVPEPDGLPLSRDFDSTKGLQRLVEGTQSPVAATAARRRGRLGWWLAYAAAAGAAVAIAVL